MTTKTLSPYASILKTALRVSDEDAKRVEVLCRWWHGTLDSLTERELQREGAIQLEALQVSREDAKNQDHHDFAQEARNMLARLEIEAGLASA